MKKESQIREYLIMLIEQYQELLSKLTASNDVEEIVELGDKTGDLAIKIGTLLWVLGDHDNLITEPMEEWLSLLEAENRRLLALPPEGGPAAS